MFALAAGPSFSRNSSPITRCENPALRRSRSSTPRAFCRARHLRHVHRQRDRRGAGVLVDLQILDRPRPAEIGERVPVAGARCGAGAPHLDQHLRPQPNHQRIQHGVGQLRAFGDVESGQLAGVQRLQKQLLEAVGQQARVCKRQRHGRRERRHRKGRRHLRPSASGNSTSTNLMAAGPIVTTQMAGKMQNTSGNTILTPVLAAASSAR